MLGPVFDRELTLTARNRRAYALRTAYGVALLAVVFAGYRRLDPLASPGRVSEFAREAFWNLVLVQGLAAFFLTPALVAGTIAGELQRKTLGDLLTSDLSAAEIVVGKLAARLVHVGILIAASLPILVLTGLLGGFGLPLVLLSVAATLSTAYFLGGLAVLGSTQTRSVRGAMNFVFTLALTWLVLPTATEFMLPRQGSFGLELYQWIGPINAWLAPSSPFTLYLELLRGAVADSEALTRRVVAMVVLQSLYGTLLVALAVVSLRPSYRAHVGGRKRRTAASGTRPRRPARVRKTVPCGDAPMLWKELFAARPPVLQRPLGLSVVLVLGGLLIWGTFAFALPAFRELWSTGYGVAPFGSARAAFLEYLRTVATGVSLVCLLGVASDAAAGMTTEHERDTWISLITTPLTGAEIVRAKLLGAIWGVRHTAVVLVLLWLAGVASGAIHPLGLLLVASELAAATWFAAALGTWVSLRSTDTMRALSRTLACLMLVAGGTLLITVPLLSVRPLALASCTPVLLAASLASYANVLGQTAGSPAGLSETGAALLWVGHGREMILACLVSTLGYAAAARALTRSACRGFDARLDRPVLEGPEAAEGQRRATPSGVSLQTRRDASVAMRPGLVIPPRSGRRVSRPRR
ncbi:MAG: ABC transporter permease [Isosphaeraceae bacterium]|nr:ABC transporter permease [Isosphaeraceae bacterium]